MASAAESVKEAQAELHRRMCTVGRFPASAWCCISPATRKNRPIESYYHIDATILERNPPVLRQMLGFDDSWDRKGQRLVPRSTSHHPRKSEPEATHR